MNRIQITTVVSCLVALFFFAGCASAPKLEAANLNEPRKVVESVFIDRVKNQKTFESGGTWQLDKLQSYFSADLRAKISGYLGRHEAFYKQYGKYELSIGRLNDYLTMVQFDPITSCERPPLDIKDREIQRTADTSKVRVSYRVFRARAPYDREVIVTLSLANGQWSITQVQYQKPRFPLLGGNQSMSGMLDFLTKELSASSVWASQHRGELEPNGTVHAGHGMFDKP